MRSEVLGAGALLAGVLALSCCGSALLFLLFGISVASLGFLDLLAPYRSWFELLSITLLLLAWGRLYRRRACVRNNKKTFWILASISLMLAVLLCLPYMELA